MPAAVRAGLRGDRLAERNDAKRELARRMHQPTDEPLELAPTDLVGGRFGIHLMKVVERRHAQHRRRANPRVDAVAPVVGIDAELRGQLHGGHGS